VVIGSSADWSPLKIWSVDLVKILWVTSFATDMYRCSGARLVRSFLDSGTEGTLLLCVEQDAAADVNETPGLIKYHLEESTLLATWLDANRDVIPNYLGGLAEDCDCPETPGHREGCHWEWFNRNASRWFRKIASLDHATVIAGFDAIVWLDADCEVIRAIPAREVQAWFGDAAVFYHKSSGRKVVESGVLGFRLDDAGRRWFGLAVDRYRTGEFRRYSRWDDGYHFQVTLDQHPEIPAVDLAARTDSRGSVLPYSPVGQYLRHHKGVHCTQEVML
jgi:hypothetical protein